MEKSLALSSFFLLSYNEGMLSKKIENHYPTEILVQIYVERYCYLNTFPYAYMFLISTFCIWG